MPKKNRKVYRVGNRYVIKENGKVKIVSKKSETVDKRVPNASNRKTFVNDKKTNNEVVEIENKTTQAFNNSNLTFTSKLKKIFTNKKLCILFAILLIVVVSLTISLPIALTYVEVPTGLELKDQYLYWNEVNDASYYVVEINGKEYATEICSLDVSELVPQSYSAKVQAVKNKKLKSKFSNNYVFDIPKPELNIQVNQDIVVSKTYDGNDIYDSSIVLGTHYYMDEMQLKYGNNVDITITEKKFNSPNVAEAKSLQVFYSAKLTGNSAENYQIIAGSFTLNAKILPKQLNLAPSYFVKQFADEDVLNDEITDEETNQTIKVSYIRELGERIGFYDITGATSNNSNYIFGVNENEGKNKFEIIQRVVEIKGREGAAVNKIYDGGTDLSIADLNPDMYDIENAVIGYNVEVNLIEAIFNSANVEDASKITVYFEVLIDSKGVYKSYKSSFEMVGSIAPKPIKVAPTKFIKEFGDADNLMQIYYDADLNQNVGISFVRTEGENLGLYDIVEANSASSNYIVNLIEDSGHNKFEIQKRTISITSTGELAKKTYDGNIIFNGKLNKDVHYVINGTLEEYDVDINILSAWFDYSTVLEASLLTVEIDDNLIDFNNIYRIESLNFIVPAKIDKKHIEIIPNLYEKQYGDDDNLSSMYYDGEINEIVPLIYCRDLGEAVGSYNILSVNCDNSNYEFTVTNAENKFIISKRLINVVSTGEIVSKSFDNTDVCESSIEKGVHYVFNNIVNDEEPDIIFTQKFNASDVMADSVILAISSLTDYQDRYILYNEVLTIPAHIEKKQVFVEPQYYSVQYGDVEYLRQSYNDDELKLNFSITFVREEGNVVGNYNIIGAISDNYNYQFNILNGEDKYQISPRVLGITKVGNPTFNKIYDGTTKCILPIKQGVHYNLTNLNGGSNVTLNIISQEYDSKNVTEATKVIVRYTAILDGADGSQFITAGGTMEFNAVITPRAITVVPEEFNKDYLSEFELIQNVQDTVSGEYVSVTFGTSAGDDHRLTECGKYDITSISWTDTNHTFTILEGSGLEKFKINRINLTINASNRNTVYNTQGHAIMTPSSVPSRDLKVVYKLSSAPENNFSAELPVDSETYTARVIFEGDRNYLPQYIDRTLFIDRAESVITNTTPTDYVYDGNIKPLTATLNHAEAELVFSRNNYIKAGTYNYIMISVPQTHNYKAASIIVSLTIAKCVVKNSDIIYPTASEIIYGQYLYSSKLLGGSNMGSFDWVEPNILPVVADTRFLVEFIPTDMENYDWNNVDMQRYVDITVNKFIVTEIAFPKATAIIYTNRLSDSKLVGESEYGYFEWQDNTITPTGSGYYNVIFIPFDEDNYDFTNIDKIGSVYLEVSYRTFFQVNGGNEIEPMIVKEITSEPYTYREGYAFEGWFLDEALTKKASFPLKITRDTVLYASWHSEGLIFLLREGYYSVKLDAATVESRVFIPKEYKGLPVKAIESEGFKNCTALEIIVIPESVISIGHYAFVGCVNLSFVQIVNGIEAIDFGIDWIESGYVYGTDVFFNAEECTSCEGTKDFHQNSCEFYSDFS
ncbi:MAG: leucine-rich repeat protein [Roseburia sp.]|nr:leucine-rich repeat protein [Roseburia sp.]